MKTLTVNVQIQFDQFGDGDSLDYAIEKLNQINQTLGVHYSDVSPIIFTSGLDSSDVKVEGDEPYYQPIFEDEVPVDKDGIELMSFEVYRDRSKCLEDFPDYEVGVYFGDDIEDRQYRD